MHTKHHEPHDPNFNYEVRDLPFKDIAKWLFWFYVLVVVSAPVGAIVMHRMGAYVGSGSGPDHYDLRRLPQEGYPLLQDGSTAHVDIGNMLRKEKAILHGDAVDPDTGQAHLPIDAAIEQEAAASGR